MKNATEILQEALRSLAETDSVRDVENLKVHYLGKKGLLSKLFQGIKQLPSEQIKIVAQSANRAKNELNKAIAERTKFLNDVEIKRQLERETVDISLPGNVFSVGSVHPITATIRRIESIFSSIGFQVAEGPEIEDDFHNFNALNIAENHPARAMHDTFYFDSNLLLRTHTSSVQIRKMNESNQAPPYRLIAPGRVYRCDSDQTHTPMFHQVEGLLVDKDVSLTDLFGVLSDFLKLFFEDSNLKVRFRPSYFPFTEPSAEVDISAKQLGGDDWLEVLGCGLVHPKVLTNCGIDAEQWNGYAFGLGVERLAMLYYGVSDLRMFFANDLRFLEQFK